LSGSQNKPPALPGVSDLQLINMILLKAIDGAENYSLRNIVNEMNSLDGKEHERQKDFLFMIGIDIIETKPNKERGIYSDYSKLGFHNIKEYLFWYISCRELVELYDLLEVHIKNRLSRLDIKWGKRENNTIDMLEKIVDIEKISRRNFHGGENSAVIMLKYCYYCRNFIVHKNGIINSEFKNTIGSLKIAKEEFNNNFDLIESSLAQTIDNINIEDEFDFFPNVSNIGRCIKFRETFLNAVRNLIIDIFEYIEFSNKIE
jgi:hypothetical protein